MQPRWTGSTQTAKIRLGADCGSDHKLLIAKFRCKLKKVGKTTRPFRYDLNQNPYEYTVEMRNRFKGVDLIERLPEELWMEVCDIVQKRGSRPSPRKRNAVKCAGEKERYTHLNAEFKRIARRDKKTFLSCQCKEIEENNRMGKIRGLTKKTRDIKGTFHAKMLSIKDRNSMDLTEQMILRSGKNTQKNYTKKIFMTQIIMMV